MNNQLLKYHDEKLTRYVTLYRGFQFSDESFYHIC